MKASGLVLRDEFSYRRQKLIPNLDKGLRGALERGFVLSYRFFFGLLLVRGKHSTNPLFIPSWGNLLCFIFVSFGVTSEKLSAVCPESRTP